MTPAPWWLFWRRHQLREAENAMRSSEAQRPEVERLVHDLKARRAENNFAPRIHRAMRGE